MGSGSLEFGVGRPFALSRLIERAAHEIFARTCDGKHFFAEQLAQNKHGLDVFSAIPSLPTSGADRVQESFEFLFPVAQGVHLHARDLAGHADADSLFSFAVSA